MVPSRSTTVAVGLLAVSTLLLANPFYLGGSDPGDQFVHVDRTSPAEGAARRAADVRRVDHLPPAVGIAVDRTLDGGSYRVNRTGPPHSLQVLATEWRYLAVRNADTLYEPSVAVGESVTTVTFAPVPIDRVEAELGVTPPAYVRDAEGPGEAVWLGEETDDVVFVGRFGDPWAARFDRAARSGELTVPNENDASTFSPMGSEVEYVVEGSAPYRTTVTETDRSVVLRTERVSNETLLAESDVEVVGTDGLSPSTRRIVVEAIRSDGWPHRFDREEADMEELERAADGLIRHDGAYYVASRGHVDGFSFRPLVRGVLWAIGGVIGAAGLLVGYRARRGPE